LKELFEKQCLVPATAGDTFPTEAPVIRLGEIAPAGLRASNMTKFGDVGK
jgi:hypothetical protein